MYALITENVIELIFIGVTAILTAIIKKTAVSLSEQKQKQEIMEQGLLALTHDRLFSLCTELLNKGSITVDEMENLGHLYKSYNAQGGNGTGKKLYEKCLNLKVKERED